jgi:hypothetical protein
MSKFIHTPIAEHVAVDLPDGDDGGASGIKFTGSGNRLVGTPPDLGNTDSLILQLTKMAGKRKVLPSDLMIRLGLKAKKENDQAMLRFLSTINPIHEDILKESELKAVLREIIRTIAGELLSPNDDKKDVEEMTTTAAVSPVATPMAFRKKDESKLDEMTTTDGGTPGYLVPGAFSRRGGSSSGVKGSETIGYTLTPIGKNEMTRKADALYESLSYAKTVLPKLIKKAAE